MKTARRAVSIVGLSALTAFTVALGIVSSAARADEIEGSLARGGKLYDKWYGVLDVKAPKEKHPLYPAASKYADKSGSTWRCKECHGWDYKGKDGAYAKGSHYTGIKGIRAMAGADPATIVALLKDGKHGYGDKLSAQDLQDVANFVSRGQVNMDKYVDRSSKMPKRGKHARGTGYFNTLCAQCHSMQGTEPDEMKVTLGGQIADNPWEVMHKILNGQPAEEMPARAPAKGRLRYHDASDDPAEEEVTTAQCRSHRGAVRAVLTARSSLP